MKLLSGCMKISEVIELVSLWKVMKKKVENIHLWVLIRKHLFSQKKMVL